MFLFNMVWFNKTPLTLKSKSLPWKFRRSRFLIKRVFFFYSRFFFLKANVWPKKTLRMLFDFVSLNRRGSFFLFNKLSNSIKWVLAARANKEQGLFTQHLYLNFYRHRFAPARYATLDSKWKNKKKINFEFTKAKRKSFFLVKNNFWQPNKDKLKQLNLYWKKYQFTRSFRPYSYLNKKYKLYFNWADKYVFKRFPMAKKKYTVLYNYPVFADYRRLFKKQIQEQHLFRWLYRLKYKQLVKKFKKSVLHTKRSFEYMFLNFFEMRMDTVIYRLNFAFSLKQAKQWVNRGFFLINGKTLHGSAYHAQVGDCIMPISLLRTNQFVRNRKQQWLFDYGRNYMNLRLFFRQIQADQYPAHFIFNERIPAAVVASLPDRYKVRHNKSYSIQFLTLSMNKYS